MNLFSFDFLKFAAVGAGAVFIGRRVGPLNGSDGKARNPLYTGATPTKPAPWPDVAPSNGVSLSIIAVPAIAAFIINKYL